MDVSGNKFVNFDEYCETCKYRDILEEVEPCFECLTEPVNEYSHKPVKWECRQKRRDKNISYYRNNKEECYNEEIYEHSSRCWIVYVHVWVYRMFIYRFA